MLFLKLSTVLELLRYNVDFALGPHAGLLTIKV